MRAMSRTRTWLIAGATAAGVMIGAAGIAGAATNSSTTAASTGASASASSTPVAAPVDPATMAHGPGETLLTGATAANVKAAALAAVPGSTIVRVETDSSGAAYEAHLKKSDGTYVTVKFDSSFKVTATDQGFGRGPGGTPPPAPSN